MRDIINLVDSFLLTEARKQPLKEFAHDGSVLDLHTAVSYLSYYLGEKLFRVGGPNRVYQVDNSGYGAVYVIGQSNTAFGLCWPNRASGIRSVYVWNQFSLLQPPDFCFDLPRNIDFDLLAPTVAKLIQHPKFGKTEVSLKESHKITEKTKNDVNADDFIGIIRDWAAKNGRDAGNITLPELMEISDEYSVKVPNEIRTSKKYKSSKNQGSFDFIRGEEDTTDTVNDAISKILGSDVQLSVPDDEGEPDETWDTALSLAKAKQLRKLVSERKIIITGRKNSKLFNIPSVLFDQLLAVVERLIAKSIEDTDEDGKTSMDLQYEDLAEKVKHIASGKSTYIKSLLVTGGPATGKSTVVMNVIKNDLGMVRNKDYAYKKGKATVASVYRILIEQCNGGLAIFDDCDSVTKDEDGLNMLKGALDTEKVRQVDYDAKTGIVNTAVLSDEERDDYVTRLSELLRGRPPTIEDVKFYRKFVPSTILKQTKAEKHADDMVEAGQGDRDFASNITVFDLDAGSGLSNRQERIIEYVKNNLPNQIDFKGRIIFISNMTKEEFAAQGKGHGAAVLDRAFLTDLSFTSGEMLSYIEKIQKNIDYPALNDAEKLETLEYLRHRYSIGAIKADINFRVALTAFEYRVMGKEGGNWKRQIDRL